MANIVRRVTATTVREPQSTILIGGDMGGGKTIAVGSLTKYGHTVILDFDRQAEKLFKWPGINPDNLDIREIVPEVKWNGRELSQDFKGWFEALEQEVFNLFKESPQPFAVVLEGMTALADMCLNRVRESASKDFGETSLPMRNIAKEYLEKILRVFMALRCHRVITCHIANEKDELTGRLVTRPLLPGQLAQLLPTKFRNVLRAGWIGPPTARKWVLYTMADEVMSARTETQLPPFIPPDLGIVLGLAPVPKENK